jgi:hypothetical protein
LSGDLLDLFLDVDFPFSFDESLLLELLDLFLGFLCSTL